MRDKVQKIREVVKKRYECWKEKEYNSHSIESEIRMSECKHLLLMLDSLQEESVSEDLEEAADKYAPDFSNSIVSKAAVDAVRDAFKAGAQWQKEQMMAKAIDVHWLSPDQARRAVEIAREETLLEVAAWINDTFIFSKQAKEDFSQTFNIKLL